MESDDKILAALTELHKGLKRQGPGDEAFSQEIITSLPKLPKDPVIADIGCGTGGGTLLLAEHYQVPIMAVDLSNKFLEELKQNADAKGLGNFVNAIHGDMANLGFENSSLDLLWSEGSAYIITFAGALKKWRPFLSDGAVTVISELSWLTQNPSREAKDFWAQAYPDLKTEAENIKAAKNSGFEILSTRLLPTKAWWDNYYSPLEKRIAELCVTDDHILKNVISEMEKEMDLFRKHAADYGYLFYILKAV